MGDTLTYVEILRKLRLAYGFCSGFTRGEYHVIRVDFIVALRRTKGRGRRTLRSPSPPSSGLHLIHPGNPLRRGILAAAGLYQFRYLYSGAVVTPQFRIWFCFLCSGLDRSRFSRGVGLWSHVFHYWWGRSFVPAATCGFAFSFVGFALTAGGSFVLADNVTGWSVSLVA